MYRFVFFFSFFALITSNFAFERINFIPKLSLSYAYEDQELNLSNKAFSLKRMQSNIVPIRSYEAISPANFTGLLLNPEGYILTNNILTKNLSKFLVYLGTKPVIAEVLAVDYETDIALLKIDQEYGRYLQFKQDANFQDGDVIFAVSQGLKDAKPADYSITQGMMTNAKTYKTSFEVTKKNFFLFDDMGRFVGMSHQRKQKNFFLNAQKILEIANEMIKKAEFLRMYLGFNVADISEKLKLFFAQQQGVVIRKILDNSPAAAAGFKRGDLLIEFKRQKVLNSSKFADLVYAQKPGSTIEIAYYRNHKYYRSDVNLSSLESILKYDINTLLYKGLILKPIDSKTRSKLALEATTQGVIVNAVEVPSVSAEKGFEKNDIIIQVNGKNITSLSDLKPFLGLGIPLKMLVMRGFVVLKKEFKIQVALKAQ